MYYLSDLFGKKVVDGADNEFAKIDGVNVVISRFQTVYLYLRVKGEKIMCLRGRKKEFIPLSEIDDIDDGVYLYKDYKTICGLMTSIDMEDKEAYRVKEFIGMNVKNTHGEGLGIVKDAAIGRERKKLFLITEGPKVDEIWGKPKKAIPFDTVKGIDEDITVELHSKN